mmetsp:Transcript_51827/g.149461  ORF Transcript_51827/g.149461 Transcript_51827/m.149461 type:complete len:260 (+) Transcript_51827:241-1020(+)
MGIRKRSKQPLTRRFVISILALKARATAFVPMAWRNNAPMTWCCCSMACPASLASPATAVAEAEAATVALMDSTEMGSTHAACNRGCCAGACASCILSFSSNRCATSANSRAFLSASSRCASATLTRSRSASNAASRAALVLSSEGAAATSAGDGGCWRASSRFASTAATRAVAASIAFFNSWVRAVAADNFPPSSFCLNAAFCRAASSCLAFACSSVHCFIFSSNFARASCEMTEVPAPTRTSRLAFTTTIIFRLNTS